MDSESDASGLAAIVKLARTCSSWIVRKHSTMTPGRLRRPGERRPSVMVECHPARADSDSDSDNPADPGPGSTRADSDGPPGPPPREAPHRDFQVSFKLRGYAGPMRSRSTVSESARHPSRQLTQQPELSHWQQLVSNRWHPSQPMLPEERSAATEA
jgi:hypothetical protein